MDLKRLHIAKNEACPCGNGKKFKICWALDAARPHVEPCGTAPRGPHTGYDHPHCFARFLGDCSEKISNEHVVSSAVLRQLDPGNQGLRVSGYPWQEPGTEESFTSSVLKSKVLCERHNAALSPLDAIAGRLCQRIEAMWKHVHHARDLPPGAWLFSGTDLTRWLHKVLLGLEAAGGRRTDRREPLSGAASRETVAWLFGRGPRPPDLTVLVNATNKSPGPDGLSLRPLKGRGAYLLHGLEMHFLGVWFELWFRHKRDALGLTSMPNPGAHPNEVCFRKAPRAARLLIEWR